MGKHERLVTRIASVALSLVFVTLLISTLFCAMTIKRAARETKAAVHLSQLYEFIERQLWQEAALVRVHGVDWQDANWYANMSQQHTAANAIESTLQNIADSGSDRDRSLASRVLSDHNDYTYILADLYGQIDSRQPQAADTFQKSARLFDIMQKQIDQRASEQHAAADAAIVELDATQNRIAEFIVIASTIGGVLLIASASVIVRFRHTIDKARIAEMSRLAEVSLTDTLTGLGNHRAYQDDLERELARQERHGGALSLALIDVDNFKSVNDSQGHIQGDRVLATLGKLLSELRKSDRSFRLGGDEFAIILPHTDADDALATMKRLGNDAAAVLGGTTISIGLSSTAEPMVDGGTLRAQADAALYAVKHRGRNGVLSYADARSHAFIRSTEKENAIRLLIEEGLLDVVFQPIWDVAKRSPLGFEALVRPAAKYGLDGPQEAFDLAEQMGLASALDGVAVQAILDRATDLPPNALLFLNVVPESLGSDLFAGDAMLNAVLDAGLAPERVVIELTERSMLQFEIILREAKRLQGQGFQFALDDTGAGNAGLDVLRKLTVNFVKIDRAVVVQAMTDPIARAIIMGIIEIAKAMGSYVIAEGIETTELLQFICYDVSHPASDHIAIGGVQGYLLGMPESEPWSASDIESKLLLSRQAEMV